ncbi:MAG: M23 family metallopeptidase [Synechococcales bacterium]|nr:M23 family metallopeptidase [Synechococcales bacterium]
MRYQSQPQSSKPSATQSRTFLLKKLGFCLGSLGLLGTHITSTQIVQAQTSTIPPIQLDSAAPVEVPRQDAMPPEILAPNPSQLSRAEVMLEAPAEPEPPAAEVPAPDRNVAPPIELETPPAPAPAANPGYEAPATVIFSERSSGCETAAAFGQSVGEVCGGNAATPQNQPTQPTTLDAAVTPSIQVEGVKPTYSALGAPISISQPNAGAALGRSPVAAAIAPNPYRSPNLDFVPPSIKPYFSSKLRALKLPKVAKLNMIFPLAIPTEITSVFGWRIHPITGDQRMHTGTDLGAPMGTPVLAALTGRVLLSDFLGGYGLTVALEHAQGTQQTLYAHLSEIFVKPGETVQQGTVIGRVGNTGNSTGPHLHFELRQQLEDGSWVAQDAGEELEVAMAQLVQSLQLAQNPQKIAQGQLAQGQLAQVQGTAIATSPLNQTNGINASNTFNPQAVLTTPTLKSTAASIAPTLPTVKPQSPLALARFQKGQIPDRQDVQ